MAVSRYRASSPRALLVFALARIKAGWTTGANRRLWKGKCQYCLRGAIMEDKPYRSRAIREKATKFVEDSISTIDGFRPSMVGFNDAIGRKKAEVIAVLNAAIAKASANI